VQQAGQILVKRISDEKADSDDLAMLWMALASLAAADKSPALDSLAGNSLVALLQTPKPVTSHDMVDEKVIAICARAPLQDLLMALKSPAGIPNGNRALLAAALRQKLDLQETDFWEILAAAAKQKPEAFAKVD